MLNFGGVNPQKQPEGSSLHHQGKMPSAPDGVQQKLQQWHEAPHHELGQSGAKVFFRRFFPCNYWICLMVGVQEVGGSWNVNGNCLTFCFVGTSLSKQMR